MPLRRICQVGGKDLMMSPVRLWPSALADFGFDDLADPVLDVAIRRVVVSGGGATTDPAAAFDLARQQPRFDLALFLSLSEPRQIGKRFRSEQPVAEAITNSVQTGGAP